MVQTEKQVKRHVIGTMTTENTEKAKMRDCSSGSVVSYFLQSRDITECSNDLTL